MHSDKRDESAMNDLSRPVFRLIYRSRQTKAVTANLDLEVCKIVDSSIRNNQRDGITGLLVTVQGWFVQALEGREDLVRYTFGRIINDQRHYEHSAISAGKADSRLFSEWSMCAGALTAADRAILDVLDSKAPFDVARLTQASCIRLLMTVADIQRRANAGEAAKSLQRSELRFPRSNTQ
jgi:hypothetical protein